MDQSNVTLIDSRVVAARDLHRRLTENGIESPEIVALLDYADERLRVNKGLIAENDTLKRKLAEKPGDKEISDGDLFRLMQERGLLTVSHV